MARPASKTVKKASAKSAPRARILQFAEAMGLNDQATDALARGVAARKRAKITYGSVSMKATRAAEAALVENIVRGQMALKKVRKKVVKPGVAMRARKDVPLFFADPSDPKRVIRELNGKRERGTFEDGEFRAIG